MMATFKKSLHMRYWPGLPKISMFKFLVLDFGAFGTSRGGKGLEDLPHNNHASKLKGPDFRDETTTKYMRTQLVVQNQKLKTHQEASSNAGGGMLRQSFSYQLPRASCSQFLDSRELPISGALLLKEEQERFHHAENYYNLDNVQQVPASPKEVWPLSGLSVRGISILRGSNDAACVEQLLVHCASALESNDTTFAQQIMWVLNNIALVDGDPNQRVAAWFLRALVSRASRMLPSFPSSGMPSGTTLYYDSGRMLSPIQLAKFVDLTPWHRFGFSAANGAILEAFERRDRIHIIDFSISHCMQWPTLIEALANRPQGPPSSIRLSVHVSRPCVPPFVDMSYEELGSKLCMFARTKRVPFEFQTIVDDAEYLQPSMLDLREGEALAVNCQLRLHYLSQEISSEVSWCPRDEFLNMVRSLQPDIVTLVEEDSDLTSNSLGSRLKSAYNHLWIPFDLLESQGLPRNHDLRMQYEADVGRKIENIVACEGALRIERLETRDQWAQRMHAAQFRQMEFSEEVTGDVKAMLEQHATGWGLKKEDSRLLLTWKGHTVVFASAWTATGLS